MNPLSFHLSIINQQPNGRRYRARAGFGGQNHQTPNPPLGPLTRKCGRMPALVRCTQCWAGFARRFWI